MKCNVCGAYQIENQRLWRKNFTGLDKAILAAREQHAEIANNERYTWWLRRMIESFSLFTKVKNTPNDQRNRRWKRPTRSLASRMKTERGSVEELMEKHLTKVG
jgi:hypothetical protein